MTNEIMSSLLCEYIKEWRVQREENLDLNNQMFHRRYGLVIQLPNSWSYMNAIVRIMQGVEPGSQESEWPSISETGKILIIFPSTAMYRTLDKEIGEMSNLDYLSWQEIYTGMQMASNDVRYMQRTKIILGKAQLTLFLEPPPLPELIDQVRGLTGGCLIVLSRGNGDG